MELKALTSENFDLFESIFTPDGSGCYCVVWRAYDDTWEKRCSDPSQPNRVIAKKFVNGNIHLGYLAFSNDVLIGWTASGPKTEFPLLETKLGSRLTPFVPSIWSIGCIAVKDTDQKENKLRGIITAVIEKAKSSNANFLESYPTDPWDRPRSYRGNLSLYQELGFKEHAAEEDENSKILCMRLALR